MEINDEGLNLFMAKLVSTLHDFDAQAISSRRTLSPISSWLLDQLTSEESILQVRGAAKQLSEADSYLTLAGMLRSALDDYRS